MTQVLEDYSVVEGVNISKLKPLPKHVLVRWLKKEQTKGGIILPQNRQRAGFMKGILLAVGPKCDDRLKVGQTIEFNGLATKEWLGVQDPADRDTVFFTRFENIYAIVDEQDAKKLDFVWTWILVKPDAVPDELRGLLVPDSAKKAQMRQQAGLTGTVVSAGGMQDACVEGDRILFNATGATELKLGDHNGETHLVIDDEDVLGFDEREAVA